MHDLSTESAGSAADFSAESAGSAADFSVRIEGGRAARSATRGQLDQTIHQEA